MASTVSPFAGKLADPAELTDIPRLVTSYFTGKPDPAEASQRVAFGTSGHRGSAFDVSFNENHILATSQAICDYRKAQGIDGPLFIGADTHALSAPAFASALEVFAANGVHVMIDERDGYTPTPVVSHAILNYNRGRKEHLADGVVITPSHNPPQDGGFKYNPPNGGPADGDVTGVIEKAANAMLAEGLSSVKRIPFARALKSETVRRYDYIRPYVSDLGAVLDMEAIRASGVKIGIDPLGGAAVHFWRPIIETYRIDATIVNEAVDPTFRFTPRDWDGKIRMDCSSPYAMAKLIDLKSKFDVAFANDTDADRHGIVTRSSGLMNPNHYLAVAIDYLFRHRPNWNASVAVGKTMVSSSVIDRVAARLGRKLVEVPVGFKWFVDGLISGAFGFVGEESAGATFLRRDGSVWTTDKDGIILGLLGAEIAARTGKDPGENYQAITRDLGAPFYERIDAPANAAQKDILKKLSPGQFDATTLAGEKITAKLTRAPGNDAAFGGLKVVTESGWFAARPSGTEDVYKVYAESFRSAGHLREIQDEARAALSKVFAASGAA
jgi:phosphoglucomutase